MSAKQRLFNATRSYSQLFVLIALILSLFFTVFIGSDNLNIGYNNAYQINIGNYNTSHIISIGNSQISNLINNTINICTDTNNSICNIGNINSTNNLNGINNLSTLNIKNNILLLNSNNTTINNVGFNIKYNSNNEAGYIRTSNIGSSYNIKAPDNNYILSTPILTSNSNILIDQGNQTINGNILLSDTRGLDTINGTNTILNIGITNAKYIVIGNNTSQTITQINNKLEINGTLLTTGNITAFGTITTISDIKLKTNIKLIKNNILYNLKPVQYNWINNGNYDVGFIAQDVELIAPHLISKINDKEGNEYKTLSYEKIVPYLVDEIQKLNEKIINYEKIINEQNNKINKIIEYLNI